MEWKIGEIKQVNGEWYQCVVAIQGCRECSFRTQDYCTRHSECISTERSDKKSVIFKKLEKVGEPYSDYCPSGRIICFQRYKCYQKPISTEDIIYWADDINISIEIKQNKENMEEKKDNYDGNMDKECIQICDALNSISDVHTTESCCGHCKDRFMVFFTCDNPHSLAIIARVFDRRYISTSQPWYIELQTKDSGAYDYFIHSETKYDSEIAMMKDVNQIIENIKHWCDDKFASHFKGCDDKPTLAPFDINLAKQGKPVCTRDGRKARIICFDKVDNTINKPIVALVTYNDGQEYSNMYYSNGKYNTSDDNLDLMMLPEKKEGWVNVYYDNDASSHRGCRYIYDTKERAVKEAGSAYITTIKITWEE